MFLIKHFWPGLVEPTDGEPADMLGLLCVKFLAKGSGSGSGGRLASFPGICHSSQVLTCVGRNAGVTKCLKFA
jgi:hypothetical protein